MVKADAEGFNCTHKAILTTPAVALLVAKMNNGTRGRLINGGLNTRHEGLERLVVTVWTMQHNQAHPEFIRILLMHNVGIHRDEHIEFRANAFKQSPVGNPSPSLPRNRCGTDFNA